MSALAGPEASTVPRRAATTLGGLVLALGLPSLPIGEWDHEFADTAHLLLNEAIWWACAAAILLYVARVERRPLASVGLWRPGLLNLGIGLAAGVLLTAALGFIYLVLLPALHLNDAAADKAAPILSAPLWWRLISTARAAAAEELMFRGYAQQRLDEWSGSRALAVLLSCAAFTLVHLRSWGWSHELIVGISGLALSLLYLWRRNLWVNVIAHFVVDGAAFLT